MHVPVKRDRSALLPAYDVPLFRQFSVTTSMGTHVSSSTLTALRNDGVTPRDRPRHATRWQ